MSLDNNNLDKLESLKSQYEEQIAQLKGELEDTTRRTPDDPGGTTGPSAEEQGGAEGQTAPSPGPASLGQVRSADMEELANRLKETEQQMERLKEAHEEEMNIQVEAMRITLTEMHKSQLNLMQLDNEEKAQAVAELEAQLAVMEEKIQHLQRETGGDTAEAGLSTQSGLCYSPSCSGAGDGVCYSPSCLHPLPTVDIDTAATNTTSNVFDSSSTGAIISGMIDSNYNATTDNTNNTGGLGLTTACYITSKSSSTSLSDIRLQSTLTGQNVDETNFMHDYILTGCYSPACFSGACYSPTCPNFRLYLEITDSTASHMDVIQTNVVEHAPHSDSTVLHDISNCYSPSCANPGSASGSDKNTVICYSPSCLSRGSSEEGQPDDSEGPDGGDDENKENMKERPCDHKSEQSGGGSGEGGFGGCYSPSCIMEGTGCYSPSCVVRMGTSTNHEPDSNLLLVDWGDENASGSSLNPFITGQDSVVQTSAEGQINWDMMGYVTSLHDSLGGTLESSSHVVSTQEMNPFGDSMQSLNTNPFADDLNPLMSNTGASQGSCDMKQSVNPFEDQNFDMQNFDPFATSKSGEPLAQSFASDFDPFTPQTTAEPLDRSRESLELLDVFGSDVKDDVLVASISELSDSVFASTGAHSLSGLVQNSANGLEHTADMLDKSREKSDQGKEKGSSYKNAKGFDNPLYGSCSLEDSGSVGFGSPFGTTTFGSEFGDLEHVRQYAKLMEERDNGSDDASSIESGDDNGPLDLIEATAPAPTPTPGKTLISNVELHTPGSTKGTEEMQVEDHTSDIQVVGETTSNTRSSQDMDEMMKTFDQLKLNLGSLARTESTELLDTEEPQQPEGPSMKAETFNIPPEADLGDSDFMANDSARTTSSYSYTSNPMSSRRFQETLDLHETGESHFSFDERESHHALDSQRSDADRSFSESFHETRERNVNDHSGAADEVSALEARQDSELLFDAESGEVVRSSIDEDMSGLSSIETLPIRGSKSTETHKDDVGDEPLDITDDDVEYIETPRSEEYGARPFEDKKRDVQFIENAPKNESDEVMEVSDDDMEHVETPRSQEISIKSVEEEKRDLQRKGKWNGVEGDEVMEVADDDGEYIETPRSNGDSVEVEEKQTMQEKLANDEAMEITADDGEYVETPRSQHDIDKSVEEQNVQDLKEGSNSDGDTNESIASSVDADSRKIPNAHQKVRITSSVLGDEDVSGRSDVEIDYIPSPEIDEHRKELEFGSVSGSDAVTKEANGRTPPATLGEMDISSEDVESLDGDSELKTPTYYDRKLSNNGFEVDMETNDGVLFQNAAEKDEEKDSEMPEILLDVENEARTSNSVPHSSKKCSRASDESIPEKIDIESSEENVEDNEEEVTITINRSSVIDANNERTDPNVNLTDTIKTDETTKTADGREEDAHKYPHVGEDEAMTISDDEVKYVETPRSPKGNVEHNSDGSDADSSYTQDTVLKVPIQSTDGDANKHVRLTKQTSVLGDEDVDGMSDSMVDYVPSPRINDLREELGENGSKGKGSASEENSIILSADMDVSAEDVESLNSESELKASHDFDRRTSNAGFEVDKDTNDGVLFEGSTSDETVEPKETEEILELENEETESSSAVSSHSKEKKTVTFGNTYELRAVGDEVIEVSLGDSVEFVKSSSEDESQDNVEAKDEARVPMNKNIDISELGDETIVCSDTEYVETPREEPGMDLAVEGSEKIHDEETPESPRDTGKRGQEKAVAEGQRSSDTEDDSIRHSEEEKDRSEEKTSSEDKDVWYESDQSDSIVSSYSLDDDTMSDRVEWRRTLGRTCNIYSGSDGDKSTSSSNKKEKQRNEIKISREDSTDESIPEEIEFENSEEIDADDEDEMSKTMKSISTLSDLGHKKTGETDEVTMNIGNAQGIDSKKDEQQSLSTTYVVENLDDESVEIDQTEYVETPWEDLNRTPTEASQNLLGTLDENEKALEYPRRIVGSMYIESESDGSVSEDEIDQTRELTPNIDPVVREEPEEDDALEKNLSSTIGSATSGVIPLNDDTLGRTYEVTCGGDDDVESIEKCNDTPRSTSGKMQEDNPNETNDNEIGEDSEIEDASITKEIEEPDKVEANVTEDSDDHSAEEDDEYKGPFGTTFKVDATEDEEGVVDDDAEYVETRYEGTETETDFGMPASSNDGTKTPRSPGRVVGSMFAESDSDESEKSDIDTTVNVEREVIDQKDSDPVHDSQLLNRSLSSTVGSETAEVIPFNDDKLGRTYEVLRGDDDDVEYIERWHGAPQSTTTTTSTNTNKKSTNTTSIRGEKVAELDNKDPEIKKQIVDVSSDEENEFLDDMLATTFYDSSGVSLVDHSLDLRGPELDIRSVVDTTSAEQIEKDRNDDEDEDASEETDDETALDRPNVNIAAAQNSTIRTESRSGLGLSSILASNVMTPDDVVSVSVIQDDFEISQSLVFPHQSSKPEIVEISNGNEATLSKSISIGTTIPQTGETLENEARSIKSNEFAIEDPAEPTAKQEQTVIDSTKDEPDSYNFATQAKDVLVYESLDKCSQVKVEEKVERDDESYNFSLEIKDGIEDLKPDENDEELTTIKNEKFSSNNAMDVDTYNLSMSINDVIEDIDDLSMSRASRNYDAETESNGDADKYKLSMENLEDYEAERSEINDTHKTEDKMPNEGYDYALVVKDTITSDQDGVLPEIKSYIENVIEEAIDIGPDESNTSSLDEIFESKDAADSEFNDQGSRITEEEYIVPEVKSFVENVIERACDLIVEIESQRLIEAFEKNVESDENIADNHSGDEVSEEVAKEDAVITGFSEAPYAATFTKDNKDSPIESVIAVDSSITALEAPPSIVVDEYETDSDVEQQIQTPSGIDEPRSMDSSQPLILQLQNELAEQHQEILKLVAQKAGREYADGSEETRKDTETMLSEYLAPEDEESDDDSTASIDELARAKKDLAYLRARVQSEYQQLLQIREDLADKLSSSSATSPRDTDTHYIEEIEKLKANVEELQVSHKKQVDELQNQIQKLKDEHETELADLQNQLQEGPDRSDIADEEALSKIKIELQNEHETEIEDLRDYYEKKIKDMENRLKRELELLQSEHESEMELINSARSPGNTARSAASGDFEVEYLESGSDTEIQPEVQTLAGAQHSLKSASSASLLSKETSNSNMNSEEDIIDTHSSVTPSIRQEREDSEDTEGEQDDISEEIVSESPDNLSEASNEQLVSELERTLSFRAGEIEKLKRELEGKHEVEMEKLKAVLKEVHMREIEELTHKHKTDMEELRFPTAMARDDIVEKVEAVMVESPDRQKEDELSEVQKEITTLKEQHEEEIGKLKNEAVAQEGMISRLETELKELEEAKEQIAAKHKEDLENIRNEMSRQHDEKLQHYSQLLHAKELEVQNLIDDEVQRIQGEMEAAMLEREEAARAEEREIMSAEIDRMKDQIEKLKEEIDRRNSQLDEEDSKKDRNEVDNLKTQLNEAEQKLVDLQEDVKNAEQRATEQLKHDLEEAIHQWQNEKAQLLEDRQKQLEDVNKLHESEIEALRETHAAEMADVNANHQTQIDKMKEIQSLSAINANGHGDHDQSDMEQLKEELSTQLETEKTRLAEEWREKMDGLERQLETVNSQHVLELDALRDSIRDELAAENMKRLEELTDELEKSHQVELDGLKQSITQQYEEQILRLEDELTRRRSDSKTTDSGNSNVDVEEPVSEQKGKGFEEKYKETMDLLEKQHAEEIEKLKTECAKQMQDKENEFKAIREDLEKEIELLKSGSNDTSKPELGASYVRETEAAIIVESQSQLSAGVAASKTEEERASVGSVEDDPDSLKEKHQAEMSARTEQIERLSQQLMDKMQLLQQAQDETKAANKRLKEQKEEHELILSRRDREHEEGSNLVAMLRSDVERLGHERDNYQETNERLLHILSDVVKTNLSTEEKINRRLAALVAGSSTPRPGSRPGSGMRRRGSGVGAERPDDITNGASPPMGLSQAEESTEGSVLSFFSDEGLDLSQHTLTDTMFVGPELDTDGEEVITDAGNRVQSAVEKLMEMMATSTTQLRDVQASQNELVDTLSTRTGELDAFSNRCEDLERRLKQEQEAREYLALELNKAEGLVEGYASEKKGLDESVRSLEDSKELLIVQLEHAKARLHELEESRDDMEAREEELQRQRLVLEDSFGIEEREDNRSDSDSVERPRINGAGLLHENSKLMEEKRELKKLYSKDKESLESKVRNLEMQLEELREIYEKELEEKKDETDDLRNQVEALDKKVKANIQFMEEQALEREQEREEFQHELDQLQTIVKEKEKKGSQEHRLQREELERDRVEQGVALEQVRQEYRSQCQVVAQLNSEVQDLEEQLRDRIDLHNQALLKKDSLEHDLQHEKASITELSEVVKQLELQLDSKTASEKTLQEKLDALETQLARQDSRSVTPSDSKSLHADDGLTKVIHDLENQLETAKNSQRLADEKIHELEQELKNLKNLEEELTHDKIALQKKVHDQMNHISQLKSQVEDLKLGGEHRYETEQVQELQKLLEQEREAGEMREKEKNNLVEQLEQFKEKIDDKEDELQQVSAQLEISKREKLNIEMQMESTVKQLEEEREELQAQVRVLREQVDSTPMPVVAQKLIDEKNAEIDELSLQVQQLQEDLAENSLVQEANNQVQQLTQDLAKRTSELAEKATEVGELQNMIDTLRNSEDQTEMLEELKQKLKEKTDELKSVKAENKDQLEAINKLLQEHEENINKLEEEYESKRQNEIETLQEAVEEKESQIAQLHEQNDNLQQEIANLSDLQTQLQSDFDTAQSLVDTKQKHIEHLARELEEMRPQAEGISADIQKQYEDQLKDLQKQLQEKKNIIEEKEEETYAVNEQLINKQEQLIQEVKRIKETVESKDEEIKQLRAQLQVYQSQDNQQNTTLVQQLREKEEIIDQLQEQLSLSQNTLKSRTTEFNRAISELEKQKREPIAGEVMNLETVGLTAAAPQTRAAQELAQINLLKEEFREKERLIKKLKDEYAEEFSKMYNDHQAELDVLRNALDPVNEDDSIIDLTTRVRARHDANDEIDRRIMERLAHTQHAAQAASGQTNDSSLQTLVDKVHNEGVRVLTLSEHVSRPNSRSAAGDADYEALYKAWQDERRGYLAAIQSLKDLLAETQRAGDMNKSVDESSATDWRADLLQAVSYVFTKERESLLSELKSHAMAQGQGSRNADIVEAIEDKIRQLEEQQRNALEQMISADRLSLLGEIRDLRSTLSLSRLEKQDDHSKLADQLNILQEQFGKRERELKRKVELSEYKIQQERVVAEDLRSSLEVEKARSIELASQLSREHASNSDLHAEIADSQNQISKLRDALEREQNRLVSASNSLDEERKKYTSLLEALTMEQVNTSQLQSELDAERSRNHTHKQRNHHIIESMRSELEIEREHCTAAQSELERERVTSSSLRRELDVEKEQHRATKNKYKAKVTELRTTIEVEKSKTEDMNGALQRERQLSSELRETLDEERSSQNEFSAREKAAIADMQAMLELERSKMAELNNSLKRERQNLTQMITQTEAERDNITEQLEEERTKARQLRNNYEMLLVQKQELERQLRFESEKLATVTNDRDRLQASLSNTQDKLVLVGSQRETEKLLSRRHQRQTETAAQEGKHQHVATEAEIRRLQQHIADLELQLAEARRSEIQVREERDIERLKSALSPSSRSGLRSNVYSGDGEIGGGPVESVRQRLHLLLLKHQDAIRRNTQATRDHAGEVESIAAALLELIKETEALQKLLSQENFACAIPAFNEKILKHNSELTSFISRLSDEKRELRAALGKLEEQIWHYRQRQSQHSSLNKSGTSDERGSAEGSRDKAVLTLQLHETEKEMVRLKSQVRRLEIELEREREKYTPLPVHESTSDREKMQRLYGRYLRVESYRKALVYQKKYFMALLNGFQDTEEDTLKALARMGAFPDGQSPDVSQRHTPPFRRFRSAVRTVIAVTRMKFLVKKWKRATRVGYSIYASNIHSQNGASYIPSSNGFPSPRQRDSFTQEQSHSIPSYSSHHTPPRPTLSQQSDQWEQHGCAGAIHRPTFTTPPTKDSVLRRSVEGGNVSSRQPITPSEDSNHSPDGEDPLNDYINRLENLQIRLGRVTQESAYSHPPR